MLWILLACTSTKDTDPTETAPVTETQGPTVCSTGNGHVQDVATAVHVQLDGDDLIGDGSLGNPLATLDAALALAQANTAPEIAVGEGSFPVALSLTSDIAISGCGADSVLTGSGGAPAVEINAAVVTLRGLTVRGGDVGVSVWNGGKLGLDTVWVDGSTGAGILVRGTDTLADLDQVQVSGVQPTALGGEQLALGVAVLDAKGFTWSGGGVTGATGVGVFVDGAAQASLSGLQVNGTATTGGRFGRGIQFQDAGTVSVTDSQVADNADAGVVAFGTTDFTAATVQVDATLAAGIDGSTTTTGDGIVVSQQGGAVGTYTATLEDNTVTGSARAGILVDAVTASLSRNTATGNGLEDGGVSLFSQGGAVVSGTDTVNALAQDLELERSPLDASGL